ncbi:transposase, partial [Bacillus altitudinis]
LEEAFKSIFPKADVQRCVVHKVRSTMNKARKKDQAELSLDLKRVYTSSTFEEADKVLKELKEKWKKTYSRELASWEEDLPVLLTFLHYPEEIQM